MYVNAGVGYALESMSGVEKWRTGAVSSHLFLASSSPAIGPEGTIYFGGGDSLSAVFKKTGAVLWKSTAPNGTAGHFTTPAVGDDGTVYCLHTGSALILYAFDGKSGAIKWQFTVESHPDTQEGSVALGYDGTVYVRGGIPLYALYPSSGTIKWQTAGFFFDQTPVIAVDGTVYLFYNTLTGIDQVRGYQLFRLSTDVPDISQAKGLSVGPDGSLYGVSSYRIYQYK